ncbi:MAG: 23S rRNA (uridine(2552)-2'-O)-methyltransferase RlmE [Candidatus Thioglobus sp.]|jgi:23S rRNA (uridine2552-2'-O)-methyltransferase|uniref:23S rRNA (uridine(2552)-2'-O)-methyltransferase RlmE n=1 Tax=Candidatus Thioglobus sp. TaxID=2026721 RepID=UPI001DB31A5C|nr:23S rRNA (uridine(2552)-2'-O)-methyltransferase RlmE [Candidatus Thioglobus sp.]MBT3186953.1 23S rRNA (uridine(2552)-2'-O)-methyltransferase RlmE [Candidatus Thioglobus sp.]MBT3431642.1 23S rRNA (uridine(2552)-2'-O)-methyltransferase RlmE [Candidatus Thioglobus sp.]MBT3965654.1 23S rRNA (uridine(2552)-2'-O)-methyltransferase RlmE [Candidatus Thioglobus sp.]MBT4553964.1 23S rRNA (uridine(2552)-2'-O)-methyltransferase RlmE [Candidatus Thioglobus sp.]MBT5287115.1 23S rRNA (uridine(2552)-2'-O)-
MGKKGSSGRWMSEHLNDEYVKRSQKEGYRSRAVYKLTEIIEKDKFITRGSRVLDLGAAPGGWSQIAIKLVGKTGQVIASDILEIEPITGVDFLQGDFTQDSVYEELLNLTQGNKMDAVLSDMAPNMSGQLSVDIPKSMYLCELALDMAIKTLTPKGSFFIKIFQGDGFDGFVKSCRDSFVKVTIRKPKASRARSKEVYLLANTLK